MGNKTLEFVIIIINMLNWSIPKKVFDNNERNFSSQFNSFMNYTQLMNFLKPFENSSFMLAYEQYCPADWITDENLEFCYNANSSSKSWEDAKNKCIEKKAELFSMNSKEEAILVMNETTRIRKKFNIRNFYVNLKNRSECENRWCWANGELHENNFQGMYLSEMPWQIGEPNGISRQCGQIWFKDEDNIGGIDNVPCNEHTANVVCKRPKLYRVYLKEFKIDQNSTKECQPLKLPIEIANTSLYNVRKFEGENVIIFLRENISNETVPSIRCEKSESVFETRVVMLAVPVFVLTFIFSHIVTALITMKMTKYERKVLKGPREFSHQLIPIGIESQQGQALNSTSEINNLTHSELINFATYEPAQRSNLLENSRPMNIYDIINEDDDGEHI